ncbi:MAG TPA: acyl-CoA dehydrogenase family protein, partial [Nitrolancea sp.]|nr:acyl-CoA dehydrogenase family protein [Nitrolancea sp.]
GSTLCEPIFENVAVPAGAMLGQLNQGWDVVNATLEHSRVWIAAQAAGIARAALDEAEQYAAQREQFGRLLQDIPAVANHLAVMRRQVELAEYLVDKAARQEEAGDPLFFVWASLAKLIASETALWAAGDAMLLHGGTGYVNEMPISRIFRDSAVLRIYEGAAHIQVKIIERYLERAKIAALFPPTAGLMLEPSELAPLPELIAEIETWQPSQLAAV